LSTVETRGPRILMITAELAPWAKVGGLGDVLGALPGALNEEGADTYVAIPYYNHLKDQLGEETPLHSRPLFVHWDHHGMKVELRLAEHPNGFKLLLIDCPSLYARNGIYHDPQSGEYGDNLVRWTILCKAALMGACLIGGEWDVVHAHDMHAALSLPLLCEHFMLTPLRNAARVVSIHNLAYQGHFPLSVIPQIGLDPKKAHTKGPYEFYGHFNIMKSAIEMAHGIHTVSPTYAHEIVSQEDKSFGMKGVLSHHKRRVRGIVNGIDTKVWDPETDPLIAANYSADDRKGKEACRAQLLKDCGWTEGDERRPIIGLVSRLAHQKGIDILYRSIPQIVSTGARLVFLGSGDPTLERALSDASHRWPDMMHARITFSEEWAHKIYAGSDMFIMPSRFEPCGLSQLYSMRYGTLPIAHATGGLVDTIQHVHDNAEHGTGFLYAPNDAGSLAKIVKKACWIWRERPELWDVFVDDAMRSDFSWQKSARECLNWYREMLG